MKPSSSVFGGLLLAFSVALLVAMVAQFVGTDAFETPVGVPLSQADWQVTRAPAFSAPPLLLDSASLPPQWRSVALPLRLPIALIKQAESATAADGAASVNITWLRLSRKGMPSEAGPLALYGARIRTDGSIAVYVNGRLVHRAQLRGPSWNGTRTPLWVALDAAGGDMVVSEILIRLEHTQGTQVGLSSLWLGPADALLPRYRLRQWLQQELPAMLSAAFMAVGVFALLVWTRRRHEAGYVLFFSLAMASFLRGLHFYVDLPIANDGFAWLTVNALFWLVAVVHLFLCQLHGRPLRWLTRTVVGVTAVVGLLTLPVLDLLPNTPKVQPLIYAIAALMGAAVGVAGALCAWRRSAEGRLVAGGVAICTLLGVSDWLLQNNYVSPEGWYLGAYSNAVSFSIFGWLMYRRYAAALAEVEQLNASLAQRLAAREAELEVSHRRLRAVELQQMISGERQRLMQDMHDGLGSTLISAIRSVEHGRLSDINLAQTLHDCLDDLKLAIDSMEPLDADLLLLLATLRFRLGPRLDSVGMVLRWDVQDLPALAWLNPSSALHILRILQEGISNILRHTRATEIRVATARETDGVRVTIEDNGAGFDPAQALRQGAGRGMVNQQRRAQAIAGRVSWSSGAGGTQFMLWLPLAVAAP